MFLNSIVGSDIFGISVWIANGYALNVQRKAVFTIILDAYTYGQRDYGMP